MFPACRALPTSLDRRAAVSAALALLAAAGHAESTPYGLGVSAGVAHESNLLRLADGRPAPEGLRRSDTSRTVTLLARVDQSFGRQQTKADLSLRDTRYAANSRFDNLGYTAQAGWDWSTEGRISGSVKASADRALYSFNIGFDSGLVEQRNLQDTRNINASVAVGLVTQWSLVISAGRLQVDNSLDEARVQALTFGQDRANVGLHWRPSGGAAWSLNFDHIRGRYPRFHQLASGDFAADHFKQSNLDIGLTLQPGGASKVELHLGHTGTRYDINQSRDFSGATGRMVWNWQPSAKLMLSTRLSRDTGQNSNATTVFGASGTADFSQVTDTLRLQVDYDFSARIRLTASRQSVRRTIVNTIEGPFIPLVSQRKESTDEIALGLRWAALRSVLLGCDFNTLQRRTSGSLPSLLHADSFNCFGQIQMQL